MIVQSANLDQVLTQRLDQRGRQDGDPVFRTLAVPHHDAMVVQVQILHPESQRLHEAQATAIEKAGNQPVVAAQVRDDTPRLRLVEYGWQPLGPVIAYQVVDPWQSV